MFKPKITVSKNLIDKIKAAATTLGVSEEEFVETELNKSVEKILMKGSSNKEISKAEEEEIANQLKGLGYLE